MLLRRRARVLDAERGNSIGWLQFIYGDRYPAARPTFVTKHNEHHKHEHNTRLLLPPTVSSKYHPVDASSILTMSTDTRTGGTGVNSGLRPLTPAATSFNPFTCCGDCMKKLTYRILRVISTSDADVEAKRGSDAVQYLMFQRYIMYYLMILTTVCVLVLLPIHMRGSMSDRNGRYARTVVTNMDMGEDADLLWAHAVISVLMLPLALLLMSHFNGKIKSKSDSIARRTLLMRHIPREKVNKESILILMRDKFPDAVVEGIQLVYDIKYVRKLHSNLINAQNAISCVWQYIEEYKCRYEMRPYFFGHFGGICCCCCFCPKVDGMIYFREEELRLQHKIAVEFKRTIDAPIGSVFITFESEQSAEEVNRYFNRRTNKILNSLPFVSLVRKQDELKPWKWIVSFAPNPVDVNWNDVTASGTQKWIRRIIVFFFIIVIFVFLTTPLIVVKMLEKSEAFSKTIKMLTVTSPLLTNYLTPLLLVITASVMPVLIMWITSYLPCERLSDLDHQTMWIVFVFSFFMILVLPSLGLTSFRQILETAASSKAYRWECAFTVDNGAFFINYIIQSAFIGTAFELLHFSELLTYFWYGLMYSYSNAEYENVKQEITFDFCFGSRYPKFLLIFCMVGAYCMSCPLIAPVGLLFMGMKHLVDKYNIYYAYEPVKINDQIHETATTFFYIGVCFMQAQVFLIAYIYTSYSDITGFMTLSLLISSLMIFMRCCCGCLPSLLDACQFLHLKRKQPLLPDKKEFCACLYLPPVLYDLNGMKIAAPKKKKKRGKDS